MNIDKKHWRPSPILVVLTTAVIVILVTMLVGWLHARRYRVNARVEIAEPISALQVSAPSASANALTLPDGEVARLAMRVREATGLLMGLCILATSEQMSNRNPASVDALVSLMSQRTLFPPGINQTSAKGVLTSDHAKIYVRYRSWPFGMEVVSIGREKLDGPALIARLVAGSDDNSAVVLLMARRFEEITLPQPFAPLAEIAALNWDIEPLRERSFAQQEIEQLNAWAKQYATIGR